MNIEMFDNIIKLEFSSYAFN